MNANDPPEDCLDPNDPEKTRAAESDPGSGTPLHPGGARRQPQSPPSIPDHELLRVIGRGAYGEVWLARNVMGTYRAVKVVYRDTFESDRPYEREFSGIQSFEPISRAHESQVDILHIGRNEEQRYFFYVMELADDAEKGREIVPDAYEPKTIRSELKRRGRFSFEESLEICLALTTAVEHLHKHGLIHRDIKPANAIFLNGLPKLADIGLVTETDRTMSFVGTEGYLPPEGPGSVQADIYSLGKTLYEVATGKDRLEFPDLPTLTGSPSEEAQLFELNEVLLKACHPEKEGRYRDAGEMHADLVLLQAGKSVRRSHAVERRLAMLTRVSVAGTALTTLLVAGYFYQQFQTREATRLQRHAEDLVNRMQIQNAENMFERGDSALALAHLAQVLRRDANNRVAAERIMAALTQRNFLRLAVSPLLHEAKLITAHFSPDAQSIVTASKDRLIRLWNARSGKEMIPPLRLSGGINSVEFSPDGLKLVAALQDRSACILDARTGGLVFPPLKHGGPVTDAKFDSTGRFMATASRDAKARIYSVETGQLLHAPLEHDRQVNSVAFGPDGQLLATASDDATIKVWEVTSGRLKQRFNCGNAAHWVRFSGDGKHVAGANKSNRADEKSLEKSLDWELQVWDVETGRATFEPILHYHIYSLNFSPDSRRIVTADVNVARVFDVTNGQSLFQLPHAAEVYAVAFSPDGRRILTASMNHSARLWDASTGTPITEPLHHEGPVHHAEFSSDGERVLAAGWGHKTVRLWNVRPSPDPGKTFPHRAWVLFADFDRTGQEALAATGGWIGTANGLNQFYLGRRNGIAVWDLFTATRKVRSVLPEGMEAIMAQFTPAGPKALIGSRSWELLPAFSRQARLWDPAQDAPVGEVIEHEAAIQCAHFSADGLTLATGTANGAVGIWDALRGTALIPSFAAHNAPANSVRFSPDGKLLLSASDDHTAVLWDAVSGQPVAGPLKHDAEVWFAQFSPKGDKVVTVSRDYSARIWQTNGTPVAVLRHSAAVEYAEFSPDETKVVTASGDRTARLWSVATGKQLTEPLLHAELVMTARFSPDGLRVITASFDRTAQVWDVGTGLKLGDPFRRDAWVVSARFSPDSRQAITASLDRTTSLWDVPVVTTAIPPWLAELAEAVGGQRLDADRIPQPVPWTEYAALRARLARLLETDPNTRWAKRLAENQDQKIKIEVGSPRVAPIVFGMKVEGAAERIATVSAGVSGVTELVHQFESPSNFADCYGVRLTGYLVPPKSGPYRFYLGSEDEGALFLSTDDSPGDPPPESFSPPIPGTYLAVPTDWLEMTVPPSPPAKTFPSELCPKCEVALAIATGARPSSRFIVQRTLGVRIGVSPHF